MDLKNYLAILNGNKWVIVTTVFITVVVTTLITFMITPSYTASATLRVATASSTVAGNSDYMYADRLMNTYTKIATSGPVLKELANKLNLKTAPQVKVETIPNTELIRITVESSDPIISQNAANTLTVILMAQGKELYSGSGKSAQEILGEQVKQAEDELNQARKEFETYIAKYPNDTVRKSVMNETIQLKEKTYTTLLEQYDQARLRETLRANIISIVEPARLPLKPSKPNKPMTILLGFMVGLAGGIGLAFLLEMFSTRLYSSRQIEAATELNAIGKIPIMHRNKILMSNRGEFTNDSSYTFNEAFRHLQVKLSMINPEKLNGHPLKTLMITSSEPGEGKSTITANLAIAIAQAGKKVVVVDCDLHIPRQHKINGLPNKVGLTTILGQKKNIEAAVRKTHYPGMYVLTSGPLPPNPTKLLETPQMKSLLMGLAEQYDMVLLDTPALLAVADSALLTPLVDGVVLVVRRNFVKEDAVKETCRHLAGIKAPMIGVVVNDAELNGTYYYYRHH